MKLTTVMQCLRELIVERNSKCAAYLFWKLRNGDGTLRLDYPLGRDSIVLDVGGFRGEWAAAIAERYSCRLLIFEPVAAHLATIKSGMRNHSGIEIIGAGLAGRARETAISLGEEGSSTLLQRERTEMIQLLDVVDVFAEHGLQTVDLMKINIEGGEYELLERMYSAGLMPRVQYFQIQFHDFVDNAQERMRAIRKMLSESHQVQYCYPFVWEGWVRL